MITSVTFDDISPTYLPSNKFKLLLDFLKDVGIPCTFFVIPGHLVGVCSSESEFKSCLKTALSSGHEISLHGYRHTKNEFGYFSLRTYSIPLTNVPLPCFGKQKKDLEQAMKVLTRLTGVKPLGFRSPFYLHNNQTLRALSNLGFKYDSSKTVFKPTNSAHLRIRWLRHCKPRQLQGLLEIPVTGDYTYNINNINFTDSLNRAIRDFEWVKSNDGVFVINIHPNKPDINLLGKFLHALYEKLDGRTEFSRLIDVPCNRYNK